MRDYVQIVNETLTDEGVRTSERAYLVETGLVEGLTTAGVVAHLVRDGRLQTIRVADTTLHTEALRTHAHRTHTRKREAS